MLRTDLDHLREADIQELIDSATSESSTLEFKLKPHGTSDDDKSEFAKDVCAMANADGGDIVFGVAEVKYVASKLVGIAGEDFDPLVRRLTQTLEAKVEPRLHGLRFQQVKLASGSYVAVLRVPSSFDGPHSVRVTQELRRFVLRSGNSISDMSFDQLRSSFDRTASLAEQARQFIAERTDLIASRKIPMPIYSGQPILALHVVPLAGLAGRQSVDIRELHRDGWLKLLDDRWGGGSSTFHFDGLLIHPGGTRDDDGAYAYRHVFRTGAFEAASVGGDSAYQRHQGDSPRRIVWSLDMTRFFMETASAYFNSAPNWDVSGPAMLAVSLLNAGGFQLGIGDAFHPYSRGIPDRDRLLVPAAWVEDVRSVDVPSVMRPMLDMLWQAFNAERCIDFDKMGEFRPRQGYV